MKIRPRLFAASSLVLLFFVIWMLGLYPATVQGVVRIQAGTSAVGTLHVTVQCSKDVGETTDVSVTSSGSAAAFTSPTSFYFPRLQCGQTVEAGYVVAPPSGTPDGVYELTRTAVFTNPNPAFINPGPQTVAFEVYTPTAPPPTPPPSAPPPTPRPPQAPASPSPPAAPAEKPLSIRYSPEFGSLMMLLAFAIVGILLPGLGGNYVDFSERGWLQWFLIMLVLAVILALLAYIA